MDKRLIVIILSILLAGPLLAQQDFDAYRKQMLEGFGSFRQKTLTDYESYRQKVNADYAEHMRQVWKEFKAFKGESVPEDEVKPVPPMPYDDKQPKPVIEQEIPVEPVLPPVIKETPQPQPIEPIEEKPVVAPIYYTTSYCGVEIKLRLSAHEKFRLSSVSPNAVADAWDMLCSDAYGNLLYDCLAYREQLHLCDWAYLCMLSTICDGFLGKDTSESTLLLSWLYCQSGYKMRLGAYPSRLEMLFASEHKIFERCYYVVGGVNWYPLHQSEERIRIFDYAFESEQPMSLLVGNKQRLGHVSGQRRTIESKRYPSMKVEMCANKSDIEFYDTYPTSQLGDNMMTRWAMYAEVPLSQVARERLYPGLKQGIAGCTTLEAANRLLNWVQTGFVYEYDDKVWGGDRAFFAEETLYYPYCDCEDRSILFSRLVRDLLGLDVVLVYYPGHLATAVAFEEDVKGDYLMLNGRKFVVADPTYIGAPVGRTMPQMDNQSAKVILLQ